MLDLAADALQAMAAQTTGAATVNSAASVGHSIGKAAKVLLRGRDEDLGIDAIGNLVSSNLAHPITRHVALMNPAAEPQRCIEC